jgi:hypothetical protein
MEVDRRACSNTLSALQVRAPASVFMNAFIRSVRESSVPASQTPKSLIAPQSSIEQTLMREHSNPKE